MKKLILLALNEFNVDLLSQSVERWGLPQIERMLAMAHFHTHTDDQEEHKGLDPWAQWASVQTGKPLTDHGLRHLGDVESLQGLQLWNRLELAGVSAGVWGAMNAGAGTEGRPAFFLPDPWTLSERAYPEELNHFLALPRYYAGNYLDPKIRPTMAGISRMIWFLLAHGPKLSLLRDLPLLARGLWKPGLDDHVLFSGFDLINLRVFIKYQRRFQPDFSFMFLNSIAHLQHHAWSNREDDLEHQHYSMKILDRILGTLFEKLSGHDFLIMNALGQVNIHGEKSDTLYRQVSPSVFLQEMSIPHVSVEQRMTNDAHIRFDSERECDLAERQLATATIRGKPMFDLERQGPTKLFFQLDFWEPADEGETFTMNEQTHRFFEHFEKIVVRTGEHVPRGDIFTTIDLPNREPLNHEVHDVVLDYFGVA